MNKQALLTALTKDFNTSYRDPLWSDIKIDQSIKNIILTKRVQKLSRIKQNGPTSFIYPGSVHTRLNHSLGVYNIGRKILISLINNSEDIPFTVIGVRSFIIACLLHDIGHFPYAHSLKELSLREHEEIAACIIYDDEELSNAIINASADPKYVASIIDEESDCCYECEIYRNILSGTLDPDKLDYLNRDAFFAGVPYGIQDNEYVISNLRIYKENIYLKKEAFAAIENILFSKYLMYRNVYWHKGVRSATAMIKKAVLSAIKDNVIQGSDLYFLDDYQFDELTLLDYKPFRLIDDVKNNILYKKAFEKEYDPNGELEKVSSNVYTRFEAEERIYNKLKEYYPEIEKHSVIIDIQEPISFESDIKLIDDENNIFTFNQVSKLFSKDIAKQFTESLRSLSIFTPAYLSSKVIKDIIENGNY